MAGIQRDYGMYRTDAAKLDFTNEVSLGYTMGVYGEYGCDIQFAIYTKPGQVQSYTLYKGERTQLSEPGFSYGIAYDYIKAHFEPYGDRGKFYRRKPIDDEVHQRQKIFWAGIVADCRRAWYQRWVKLDQLIRAAQVDHEMVNPQWIENREEDVENAKSEFYKAVEIAKGLNVDSIAAGVLMPEKYNIT